jgi:glycolate oxidase
MNGGGRAAGWDAVKIARALTGLVQGSVQTDDKILDRHATDQSICQVRPLAIAFPQDLEDVVPVVRFAREAGIPLPPGQAAVGLLGQPWGAASCWPLDRACPMNRLLGFEKSEGLPLVTVEPGLVHDDLQRYLRERELYLPSDPSSGAISLLGGNIATKANGPHALKHGSIDRYLRDAQPVIADGEVLDTADEASISAA